MAACAYLMMPFILFALGWIGLRYSIPMTIVLLICFWKMWKSTEGIWIPQISRDNVVKIVFILLVICCWCYFSGIGRFVFQNNDHGIRNGLYELMVEYKWPVINYEIDYSKVPEGTSATSLIYYIGFWIPAAVFGKVFGIEAGYGFQLFWAILGVVLVYYFICARLKKVAVWPLVILLLFSGLDIVGMYLRGNNIFQMANNEYLEWWDSPYQYSGMTNQLFWVFNQAVPAWVCTMLMWAQKNNKNIVLIWACCMLPSTFPFAGLLPMLFFWIITRVERAEHPATGWKNKVKQYAENLIKGICTFQNIAGGAIVGITTFLYLNSNISSQMVMVDSTINGATYEANLAKYLMFILLEVGFYFMILYRYQQRSGLYYCILLTLCVVPWITVGTGGDFCMRASIPALLILMVMVIEAWRKARRDKCISMLIPLAVMLLIGSVNPIHELTRTFQGTVDAVNEGRDPAMETRDAVEILNSRNFAGATDDSFFYKYMAK